MVFRIFTCLTFSLLLIFVAINNVRAQQSKLPPCQLDPINNIFNNCFTIWRAADGYTYFGEWKNGNQSGHGTATFATGDKYVGEFKKGKPDGEGIFYAANGSIFQQGIFKNGKLVESKILQTSLPYLVPQIEGKGDLSRSGTAPSEVLVNTHRVQMLKDGGTYTVPVVINEVLMLNFVIDSGASDVTIPADVAMTLIRTGTIKESDFIGSQKYQLADGSYIDSKQFIIRSLKVGDQTAKDVRGSIGNVKGSLLLGQSFLEKFKSWSMDNSSHELVLE